MTQLYIELGNLSENQFWENSFTRKSSVWIDSLVYIFLDLVKYYLNLKNIVFFLFFRIHVIWKKESFALIKCVTFESWIFYFTPDSYFLVKALTHKHTFFFSDNFLCFSLLLLSGIYLPSFATQREILHFYYLAGFILTLNKHFDFLFLYMRKQCMHNTH